MSNRIVSFCCIVLLLFAVHGLYANGNTGRITGKLVDAEFGEPLIAVNVFLEGTMIGSSTDLDGVYNITRVPPGVYNLVFSMIGYSQKTITDVKVSAGEVISFDVTLEPEILEGEDVVVVAEMVRNTEASLLRERQKSAAVSDAISAEAITRSGSSDAAEAMTKVTGASVVDGKYVYVRGLGERYSNTSLNGVELPSADPEKKAVQMDLFPSNLLDNIVTVKSFTPDKPGNFSGGMVDIGTKSYPERFRFKVSTATTFNTQTSFNNDYLSYPGSSTDFIGVDDGLRDIPETVQNGGPIPTLTEAQRDPHAAARLNEVSKAFEPVMAPGNEKGPMSRQLAFSVGGQTQLFGRPLGILGSYTYKNSYNFYDNGAQERWGLATNVSGTESLTPKIQLNDIRGVDDVTWGALGTLSSKIHDNHELSLNTFYSRSGESMSRKLAGHWPEQFGQTSQAVFETRVLSFKERSLQSYQLSGEHYLSGMAKMRLDWRAAYNRNSQKEPDVRYFSNHYSPRTVAGRDTIIYSITTSNYSQPARYYRSMVEDGRNFALNAELPFSQWNGFKSKFKAGAYYSDKDRDFVEDRYEYQRPSGYRYTGNENEFFATENVGQIGYDENRDQPLFGNYIQLAADPRGGNYFGTETITSGYAMIDMPVMQKLRFIGGARFEATDMHVESEDETRADSLRMGDLEENDILPSVNFVYQLSDNMNLRLAYGKTLARPTLREMAPYVNFEFVNDYSFAGNVNLKRSLIDNYDLRWEWFSRPGEIYAVSTFYKNFKDPIERSIVPGVSVDNPEITYRNVDSGQVYGIEFEARKRLDVITPLLRNFQLGTNLSLVESQVDIPKDKLARLRAVDPNKEVFKEDTRPLQGQSPYVFNLDLTFDSIATGTVATVQYNLFGDRLSEVTSDATPDVYERQRGLLDLVVSQKIVSHLSFNFSASNILDSKVEFSHEYKGVNYARRAYFTGRSFKFGLTYDIL
jgi:TonB-dependent receptor